MTNTNRRVIRAVEFLGGEVATRLGIGVQTLHFYEREGLIPAPARSASGYRLYTPEIVERVAFIRKAQALGLPLTEVRDLLRLVDTGACPCGRVQRALTQQLHEVDERLRKLQGYRAELAALIERAPALGGRRSATRLCRIVEEASTTRDPELIGLRLRRRGRR